MLKQFFYSFVIVLISSITNPSHGLAVKILSEKDLSAFQIIQAHVDHTGTDASIRKITNGNTTYILKQINDASMEEQFLLINDCIASTIGCETGIHVNEVFFVPYTVASHLKLYPERAATVHRSVPGKDLDSELPAFLSTDFTLHQRVINPNSVWQQQYPLAESQQGLSRSLIESMSFHEDLPAISALDTFVGNIDRSEPNIFYDLQTNCFYGIDQAAAFSHELASFAYERFQELTVEGYFDNCTSQIIKNVCLYRDVLRRLSEDTQPFVIIQNMSELIPYLGPNALHNAEIVARVRYHAFIIEHNYLGTCQLITLLDQILLARS